MAEKEKVTDKKKPKASKWRWLFRLLLLLLLIFILIPFIIHIKPVQNWIVDRVTHNISEKTGSTVSIGEVDFSIFKGLVLNDAYISSKDSPQDTLAYIGSFSSTLSENILSLMDNRIRMKELVISNADIQIKKKAGDSKSNLQYFLENFGSQKSSTQKPGQPINTELGLLHLSDVSLKIEDENKGDNTFIAFNEGIIDFEGIYLDEDSILINSLNLVDPIVHISKGKSTAETTIETDVIKLDNLQDGEVSESSFFMQIKSSKIDGGEFSLDDWKKSPKENSKGQSIDYNHLFVSDINIDAETIVLKAPFDIKAKVNSLGLKEQNGF